MKKNLTVLTSIVILASILNADLARVEIGAGSWKYTPTGASSYTDSSGLTGSDKSDEKEDSSAYVWILVKHPVPIVPNIRLEYANIETTGTASGKFKNFEIPAGVASVPTSLKMVEYDVIPYYNILDNTFWATLDLGIDLKFIDMSYEAQGVTIFSISSSAGTYSDSEMLVIPLGYARVRVQIPGTDIGFEADGKYIAYDSSSIYDIRAKVDYTLSFIPIVQPALEVGYRVQKFDISSDDEKTKTDIKFSGVYMGLMLRF